MKMSLILMIALLACVSAGAAGLQSKRQQKQQQMIQHATAWMQYLQQKQTHYTIKGFEKATGVKLSLQEKIMFSTLARKKPDNSKPEEEIKKTRTLSNLSLILAIAGLLILFVPVVGYIGLASLIAAVITGIIGLNQARRSSNPKAAGQTQAIVGTILGSAGILMLIGLVIIFLTQW